MDLSTDVISPATTRVELIGSPRLITAVGTVHRLERRDAALIALAAVKGDVSRAHAARLLWPDAALKNAQSSLRQRLFRLRRIAGTQLLESDGALLGLGAGVAHDLADFALRLPVDSRVADGELLDGLHYDDLEEFDRWLATAREQWRIDRRRLLAQVAEALEADGRIAQALPYAERLVADDSSAEHAHRRVIRLHYRRGDRSAGLAAFERCRALLANEIGAAPAAETLELMRLVERSEAAQPGPAARPTPVALLRPPRLVGRQAEWLATERAWARGRLVLLRGEPGIGKTRFAGDFARARSGAPVCAARPGDAALPYALLARLLRQLVQRHGPPVDEWVRHELAHLVPELGPVAVLQADALRLCQALGQALAQWAASGWSALVIDDLQFADAASLEAVLDWLAQDPLHPVGRLITVRTGEMPAALASWLGDQPRDLLTQIDLGPLAHDEIVALLDSLSVPGLDPQRWAEPLLRHTGGNPMFVLETLIAMLDERSAALAAGPAALPAPQGIGQMIERRLGQLGAPALKLARVAALSGQDFSVELAAAVLGQHPLDVADAWRELEAAQVIRDSAFAHDLIHEAARREVPQPIARAMHGLIAAQLQVLGVPPARIAAHWHAAGNWLEAGIQYRAAAAAACAVSRGHDEAGALLAAAQCFERCDRPAQRFEALSARVGALVQNSADAARQAALELLSLAGSDVERAQASVVNSEVQIVFGEFAGVIDAMPGAIAAADAAGDLELALLARRRLAVAMVYSGRNDEACALLLGRAAGAESLPSLRSRGEYFAELGTVLERADRRREGQHYQERGIELALQAGDHATAATGMANLGINHYSSGELRLAAECMQRGLRLREDGHAAAGLGAGIEMTLACALRDLGRFDTSIGLFERALATFSTEANPLWIANTSTHFALLWLALGQAARAQRALGAGGDDVPGFIVARRLAVQAQLRRVQQGRRDPQQLVDALAALAGADRPIVRLAVQLEHCLHAEPAEAIELSRSTIEEAEQRELPGFAVGARVRLVEALTRCGDVETAAGAACVAVAALERGLAPPAFYLPEAWLALHAAFAASGDERSAAHALDAGVAWIKGAALPHVPEPFRESFVHRNPVNRQLLAVATRRLHGAK